MIKNIMYKIGVENIGFNNSHFAGNDLILTPEILMTIEFLDGCVIKDVKVFYVKSDRFVVELNTMKISFDRSKELEKFINDNESFKNRFNEFLKYIKKVELLGGC